VHGDSGNNANNNVDCNVTQDKEPAGDRQNEKQVEHRAGVHGGKTENHREKRHVGTKNGTANACSCQQDCAEKPAEDCYKQIVHKEFPGTEAALELGSNEEVNYTHTKQRPLADNYIVVGEKGPD